MKTVAVFTKLGCISKLLIVRLPNQELFIKMLSNCYNASH